MPRKLPAPALIGGPYAAPRCKVGRPLPCYRHGDGRAVVGLTEAPIPWPYAAGPGGKISLSLTGDLVRAVAVESVLAISYHWGVARATASRWRRCLAIGRWTHGTRTLWRDLWPRRLGLEGARKGGLATKGVKKGGSRAKA